jgi:type I restriction enzyme S subunit
MMEMDHCPVTKLSDVAELNPTRPRALSQFPDDYLVTFVPMPAVDQFSGKISSGEVRKLIEVKKGFTYFEEGDVIFAKITPCMQNGKSAIAIGLENKVGFGSTEFHVIRANPAKILPEWIWYFVRRLEFRTQGTFHFRGAVGQQRVPVDYLENAQIPLPPLDEQRRIVGRIKECLSRVGEIERLRQESGMATEALLPSILNLEFQELLQSYESRSIGDIAIETRYGTSHKCTAEITEIPVLRIPNIASGTIKFDDLKYCRLDSKELERLILKPGDLLFVRTNGSRELVGRCAIFENTSAQKYAFASYLIRVRLDYRRIRPHFLSYFLNSSLGRIELNKRRRTSAGQFNINSENLRSIPVPVPPVDIQDQIIRRLNQKRDALLELRFDIKKSNSDSTALRESILRKAFAGEL